RLHREPRSGIQRHLNLIGRLTGFRSLAEVRAAFPAGIDPRDAAWMWRRLLVAAGAAHRAGVIHGAVLFDVTGSMRGVPRALQAKLPQLLGLLLRKGRRRTRRSCSAPSGPGGPRWKWPLYRTPLGRTTWTARAETSAFRGGGTDYGHRHHIVCGLGFGDEGKGSVTEFFCSPRYPDPARTVVRFNGGAQAAHNVVTADGRQHTFAQFGSGSRSPSCR
ncbi:MAG: adenylosuccinate synthetase, partial [Streptosporangiaceae bacterium]